MTNDERAQLEILRAEMNGKLDLLLERTDNLRDSEKDHEGRIRDLEEFGSGHAQEAVREVKVLKNKQTWMLGAATAVIVIIELVAPFIRSAVLGG